MSMSTLTLKELAKRFGVPRVNTDSFDAVGTIDPARIPDNASSRMERARDAFEAAQLMTWPHASDGRIRTGNVPDPLASLEAAFRRESALDRTSEQVDPAKLPALAVIDPVMVAEDDVIAEAASLLGYMGSRNAGKDKELYDVLAELEIGVYDKKTVKAYQDAMVGARGNVALSRWQCTHMSEYSEPVPKDALSIAVAIKKALTNANIYIEHYKHDPFLVVKHNGCHEYIAVWDEPDFDGKARIARR